MAAGSRRKPATPCAGRANLGCDHGEAAAPFADARGFHCKLCGADTETRLFAQISDTDNPGLFDGPDIKLRIRPPCRITSENAAHDIGRKLKGKQKSLLTANAMTMTNIITKPHLCKPILPGHPVKDGGT